MKKGIVLKVLCLFFSFTLILTSYNSSIFAEKQNDFDIEREEYIIKFTLSGPMLYKKYMFLLTPKKEILAEYVDENDKIEKCRFSLNEQQWSLMQNYVNTVFTLKKEDIEGYNYVTDVWFTIIDFKNVQASFDYGTSKSTAVNILLEQIIGYCDTEKVLETDKNLHPVAVQFRQSVLNSANY